ncbi:MAG: XRE family transcriptional regulator [Pseudomonadota bacterium]
MSNILHSQLPAPHNEVLAHVAQNLRLLREARGWSQTFLAERSGLSRRMISAIEGGGANVSLASIDKLAHALSVTFAQIVRPPARARDLGVASVVWEGRDKDSKGVLLGAVPSTTEAEFWHWTLAPGEQVEALAHAHAEHEMLYVLAGSLVVECQGGSQFIEAGGFLAFRNAGAATMRNEGEAPVRYVRVLTT